MAYVCGCVANFKDGVAMFVAIGNFVHHICDLLRRLKHMVETGTPVEQAHTKVFGIPLKIGVSSCPSGTNSVTPSGSM